MTTVFLSGSRRINRINELARERIRKIVDQGFDIIVGDAFGADKAMQDFLAEVSYSKVVVFCSGRTCRNNLGTWKTRQISVDLHLKGRAFYSQKDKVMAAEADYGIVLWDGRSPGSISNVFELLKRDKKAIVYYAPEKRFVTVSSVDDAYQLLKKCDTETFDTIKKKIKLPSVLSKLQEAAQVSLF